MKPTNPFKETVRSVLATAVAAGIVFGFAPALHSEDAKSDPKSGKMAQAAEHKTSDTKAAKTTPAPKPKAAPREITGPELYSMHCMRCHPERYPNERTSAQWKTILTHMRVRANLPAEQARKLLKYLQDNSGY